MAVTLARVLTGLVAFPLLLLGIQVEQIFTCIIGASIFLGLTEFRTLCRNIVLALEQKGEGDFLASQLKKQSIYIAGGFIFVGAVFGPIYLNLATMAALFCYPLCRAWGFTADVMVLEKKSDKKGSSRPFVLTIIHIALEVFGFMYIAWTLSHAILLRNTYKEGGAYVLYWIISAFQSDNGALFTGSAIGSKKFSPLVSPNKSWEGVFGAMFLSCFTGLVLWSLGSFWPFNPLLPRFGLHHYLILALLISVTGIAGDLCESFIKRAAGVKDSGALFPGHGGMLDRLDSLLIGAAASYYYVMFVVKPDGI
eukprot:GILK01002214.1.p1 GENE.GILK01002214.1~~GILK01002214.1.p1  ORF type:complete len:322 (+),score=19.87 GILK01002214.1:41-967(+)